MDLEKRIIIWYITKKRATWKTTLQILKWKRLLCNIPLNYISLIGSTFLIVAWEDFIISSLPSPEPSPIPAAVPLGGA